MTLEYRVVGGGKKTVHTVACPLYGEEQEPQRLVADGGVSISPQAAAKQGGENAEAAVLEAVPELRCVSDSEAVHYDAVAEELPKPSDRLLFIGIPLVEVGTAVEIKSALVVLADDRRGRLLFRRQQHERLLEDAGMYLVAICEPTPDRDLLALKLIPATLVDEEIESWVTAEDDPDYAQLAWSRFVHPEEVGR